MKPKINKNTKSTDTNFAELNEMIHDSYKSLTDKYDDSANSRESEYFKSFISVLDRMSE